MRKHAEKSAKNALEAVARNNGVSIETVYHEIETAIAAYKNPDPTVRAFQNLIPCKNKVPTPEEVIAYIAGIISYASSTN